MVCSWSAFLIILGSLGSTFLPRDSVWKDYLFYGELALFVLFSVLNMMNNRKKQKKKRLVQQISKGIKNNILTNFKNVVSKF